MKQTVRQRICIRCRREVEKNRVEYRRDSDAISAGLAAFRRYAESGGPVEDHSDTLSGMRAAAKYFEERLAECDDAIVFFRGEGARDGR